MTAEPQTRDSETAVLHGVRVHPGDRRIETADETLDYDDAEVKILDSEGVSLEILRENARDPEFDTNPRRDCWAALTGAKSGDVTVRVYGPDDRQLRVEREAAGVTVVYNADFRK